MDTRTDWQEGRLTDVQALRALTSDKDIQRFWRKVKKSDGCWEWQGSRNPDGYGNAWANGGFIGAHRFAYLCTKGMIPQGMHVLHQCDNPGCVNPDHLFLGTHKDNMVDKEKKGRGNRILRDEHGRGRSTRDLTGQKFGRLTAISIARLTKHGYVWNCRCDCGKFKEVVCSRLTNGSTASCGCLIRDAQIKDLTGQRFGLLIVNRLAKTENGNACWECRCDCGRTKVVGANNLRSGTKSCGCQQGRKWVQE